MTTAAKVGEDARSQLEELQAEIGLLAGTEAQQELLSRLIDGAGQAGCPVPRQ